MAQSNDKLTFKGNPLKIFGPSVKVGQLAPSAKLTANDMSDKKIEDYKGNIVVLSVVPSLDTPVCDVQSKQFNEKASSLGSNVVVLTVSRDLPFAQKRWCAASNAENIVTLSDYKYRSFGESYGVEMPDLGLLARSVFVIDATGKVAYVEYVDEMASEPNYTAAFEAVQALDR